jgi:hypothetical protein
MLRTPFKLTPLSVWKIYTWVNHRRALLDHSCWILAYEGGNTEQTGAETGVKLQWTREDESYDEYPAQSPSVLISCALNPGYPQHA